MRTIRKLIMRGNWSDSSSGATISNNDGHNNMRHTAAANNKTNIATINTIINTEEAKTNLSESIANRNILLLASTAKSSSSSSDTTSEEMMRVLNETMMHQQCEISSMKNRIATLEKKLGGIRDDTVEGGSDNIDDNIDDMAEHTTAARNKENTEELVLLKEEKDAAAATVTQPILFKTKAIIRSTTHRGGVGDNDNTQPNFKDKDNRSDIIIKEEEVSDTDIVEEKETMDFIEHPIEEPVLTASNNKQWQKE